MAQKDNILQELRELQSSLANASLQNTYQVPAGYFEGLADRVLQLIKTSEQEESGGLSSLLNGITKKTALTVPTGYFEGLADEVLNRVRSLERETASEELASISPLLSSLKKEMLYTVPAGYFEDIAEIAMGVAKNDNLSPSEELASLSAILSGLKKETLYTVPAGYFEGLDKTVATETVKPQAKVISITKQKWFRYAAAAMVTGVVAMAGFLLINKNESTVEATPEAIVSKMMKKVSTDDIEKFTELADEGTLAMTDIKSDIKDANDIKELVKDIPQEDIQKFLEETQSSVADENSDDIFLN